MTADDANARPTPLARLLGIVFTEVSAERVVATMAVRDDLCTLPTGLHGGAIMALADNAGAVATMAALPAGATGTTTIESKTNFVRGAPAGAMVTATTTPLHRGRRTQVWTTRVTHGDALVAVVTQTQLVL